MKISGAPDGVGQQMAPKQARHRRLKTLRSKALDCVHPDSSWAIRRRGWVCRWPRLGSSSDASFLLSWGNMRRRLKAMARCGGKATGGNGSQGWWRQTKEKGRKDCGMRFRTFDFSFGSTPPIALLGLPLDAVGFAGGLDGKLRMKKAMVSQFGITNFEKV